MRFTSESIVVGIIIHNDGVHLVYIVLVEPLFGRIRCANLKDSFNTTIG